MNDRSKKKKQCKPFGSFEQSQIHEIVLPEAGHAYPANFFFCASSMKKSNNKNDARNDEWKKSKNSEKNSTWMKIHDWLLTHCPIEHWGIDQYKPKCSRIFKCFSSHTWVVLRVIFGLPFIDSKRFPGVGNQTRLTYACAWTRCYVIWLNCSVCAIWIVKNSVRLFGKITRKNDSLLVPNTRNLETRQKRCQSKQANKRSGDRSLTLGVY